MADAQAEAEASGQACGGVIDDVIAILRLDLSRVIRALVYAATYPLS